MSDWRGKSRNWWDEKASQLQKSNQLEAINLESENKKIVKNTIFLYSRTILTMMVSLYTVRVILGALGALDFGIYNLVAGIVVSLALLSNTMASASQRFFAFDIGKNDNESLTKTFSTIMLIYFVTSIALLILCETVGLWFINNKLNIPKERSVATNWVYQFAILSFTTTMLTIPYNALIIARERMEIYAYVGVLEAIVKLGIAFLVSFIKADSLILYGSLTLMTTILTTAIYRQYCINNFEESKLRFVLEKEKIKEIMSYSSWNLIGASSGVLKNQGIDILLNIFFGPIVNAGRAISVQINSAIMKLVTSFTQASNPQIIKSYSANKKEKVDEIVTKTAKFSYFLLLIPSIPFIFEIETVLKTWLTQIPEYTINFSRLFIISSLIDIIGFPLTTMALAIGNIKKYQLIVGGILISNLPLSYLAIKLGGKPETTMAVYIFLSIIALSYRLIYLNKIANFSITSFNKNVTLKIIAVTSLSCVIPYLIATNITPSIHRLILLSASSIITTLTIIFQFGLTTEEQTLLIETIKIKKSKFKITYKKKTV